MIDKRIGKRIKQCRERLGLSQEAFAEKTGLTPNYISTVERGMSFPRCEKHTADYQASTLSKELASLSPEAQKRILQMVELMIRQEKENPR